MRTPYLALILALAACGGTDPGPADDDDDGGGEPLPPALQLVQPKNDGGGQTGTVARPMGAAFVVRVVNKDTGNPVPGIFVSWVGITAGSVMDPAVTQSDAYGYASSTFRAAQIAGTQYGKAVLGADEALYVVTAKAGSPFSMARASSQDSAAVDGLLSLRVVVTDQYGNGVEDLPISWTLLGGPVVEFAPFDSTANGGSAFAYIRFGPTPTTAQVTALLPNESTIAPITFQVKSY